MKSTDYGIYGLLAGVEKTSSDLNISALQVTQSIQSLLSGKKTKFLKKVRQTVLEKSMKESTKAAAKQFGIAEYVIIDLLKKYLSEEAGTPGNFIYPYDSYDRFTQTCELPMKNWFHVASQTDFPSKVAKKTSKTIEKLEEIRKSLKDQSSIPQNTIDKWKKKMGKNLFQDEHCLMYSLGKKDKFFGGVDEFLKDWWKETRPTDEKLKEKCKEIAEIGEGPVVVSDAWIERFKSHHSLG